MYNQACICIYSSIFNGYIQKGLQKGVMMQKKKAQMTIFIMIGAIILFSVVAILFFKTKQVQIDKVAEITEETPTQLAPLRSFVEDCISKTGIEAAKMIGAHGGYLGFNINNPLDYAGASLNIDPLGMNPTEFDALRMSSEWHIPYWWYLKSKNTCDGDCVLDSKRPPLRRTEANGDISIETQMDKYIDANLGKCINNFRSFNAQAMKVKATGSPKTTTTITKNSISVFLNYPIEAEWSDGKSTLSQFKTDVDINLQTMYNIATEITNAEQKGYFLETHALNLIAAYSGIDKDKLPPMAGTDFTFSSVIWQLSEVKAKVQDILSIYINVLQTTNTEGFELPYFEDDDIKTGLYSGMVVPLKGEYAYIGNINTNFNYLGWPIYLYITKGSVIRSKESLTLPFASMIIPLQRYDLPYDVSFPVMVNLHDPTALKGKGYDFFFALEGNIRNNEPITSDFISLKRASESSNMPAQLCDEKQKTSGDISLKAVDRMGNPVPGAEIIFMAGDVGCPIGETTLDASGNAVFKGKFPKGAIGSIVFIKQDYENYVVPVFRAKDIDQDLGTITMNNYIMKNISIMKMDVDKLPDPDLEGTFKAALALKLGFWELTAVKIPLKNKEHAIVVVQRVDDDSGTALSAVDINSSSKGQIRLVPGNYTIKVTLISENTTMIIPEDERCEEVNGKEECETLKEVVISDNSPFVSGQYEIPAEVDESIYSNNVIQFTAVNFNLLGVPQEDRRHEDLEDWAKVDVRVTNHQELFMPVLKSPE
jgi:hypothetical protein